jgi:hypothetical protein
VQSTWTQSRTKSFGKWEKCNSGYLIRNEDNKRLIKLVQARIELDRRGG